MMINKKNTSKIERVFTMNKPNRKVKSIQTINRVITIRRKPEEEQVALDKKEKKKNQEIKKKGREKTKKELPDGGNVFYFGDVFIKDFVYTSFSVILHMRKIILKEKIYEA